MATLLEVSLPKFNVLSACTMLEMGESCAGFSPTQNGKEMELASIILL